jgi:hypothetical protein
MPTEWEVEFLKRYEQNHPERYLGECEAIERGTFDDHVFNLLSPVCLIWCLDQGMYLNGQTTSNTSVLHLCALFPQPDSMEILLRRGIRGKYVDKRGYSPFSYLLYDFGSSRHQQEKMDKCCLLLIQWGFKPLKCEINGSRREKRIQSFIKLFTLFAHEKISIEVLISVKPFLV